MLSPTLRFTVTPLSLSHKEKKRTPSLYLDRSHGRERTAHFRALHTSSFPRLQSFRRALTGGTVSPTAPRVDSFYPSYGGDTGADGLESPRRCSLSNNGFALSFHPDGAGSDVSSRMYSL